MQQAITRSDPALVLAGSGNRTARIFQIQEKLAAAKSNYQRRRKHDCGKQQRRHGGRAGPSCNQPAQTKSMETTNRTRPSNGKTSPVNNEIQLGAAFDQSKLSKRSWRVASKTSAKSDSTSREPNDLGTASFILIVMILNKVIIFKTSDRKLG